MKYAYFNGKIIPEEEVKINFNDLGFARGYGVFDAMRTTNGQPFLLKAHFKRLQNSARLLNMELPMTMPQFVETVQKLLSTSEDFQQGKDVVIRTTVTGGISSNGLKMDGQPTVIIIIGNLSAVTPKPEEYRQGGKIILVDFQRILPQAKTTNYLTAILHQKEKERAGATEIVYHHRKQLLEGATSNIFIVKNKRVITPEKNILSGTMRNLLIQLLRQNNIPVEIRDVQLEELSEADEAFITGTFKQVLPIVQFDDKIINEGQVGEIAKQAMKLMKKALSI